MELLRESIRRLGALVLCWSLCFPAPLAMAQDAVPGQSQPSGQNSASGQNAASNEQSAPPQKHRASYAARPEPGQLEGDARILHALNRLTFGPKAGDLEAVRSMGPDKIGLDKWFDGQLHPGSMDETDLNARLADYPAMQWSTQDLMFRMPSPAMIRQAADGKIEIPQGGTLHAVYENQIYRYQLRKAAQQQQASKSASQQGSGPADTGNPAMSATAPAGSATAPISEAGPGAPAGAQQPDMSAAAGKSAGDNSAAGNSMDANSADGNSMTPAAGQEADQGGGRRARAGLARADRANADEALIANVLALQPVDRVRRLQAMQPEEFESFIKSLKPVQRAALVTGMSPDLKESVEDLAAPEQTVVRELMAERLTRDIYSNAQLQEVMTDFWLNHFNVYLRKNEQMPYYLVSYERDTIRPHALGKFEDLLEAVAHSPAMLIYLDNAQSMGPDSLGAERAKRLNARRPNAKRQAPEGLNENYARELMELHTVGVNGGYTQADVTQVARVLTGWTVDRPQLGGEFQFNENRHEPGTKKVMGAKIKEKGETEGRELLHMLAMRPATAEFISRKLAIRFVSDDPPQALVERMAKSYLASDGDIPAVLKTLFHSPEFWAAGDDSAKVKTPLEYVVSAVRASNANVANFEPLVNALKQMGMPLYGCVPPVGYKWDEGDWVSTGALVDRMNFALSLAANRLPGITVGWAPELDMSALDGDAPGQQVVPTPETEEARLEQVLLPGGVSDATRAAALKEFAAQSAAGATTDPPMMMARNSPVSELRPFDGIRAGSGAGAGSGAQQARRQNRAPAADAYEREDQLLAGLLLGSPEFQRR
ncbi:MAG: DUF1800 domain-containing protein [Terracidiphilus sp.]